MLNKNGKAYLFPAKAVYDAGSNTVTVRLNSTNTGYSDVSTSLMTDFKVIGGTGNTAATVDDADLANRVSTLTEISSEATQKSTRTYVDNLIAAFATTYQNNTGEDITISELGVFLSDGTLLYMIARQVIDPVTVRAGATYTFTMTIG